MFSPVDHAMMTRALELAEKGLCTAKPNPMVGCVIAKNDQIIAEGFHARAGEAHAEVNALAAAGGKARGATAYVTLEPCAHTGRTPPCSDALVRAGITRVVAALSDPFSSVAGRGFTALAAAGITTEEGLLAESARWLNRGFFSRTTKGRPWVRLKMAMSLDGRTALASGESKWISGEAARADVQHWRARSCAILTGLNTVLTDNPSLTVRDPQLQSCVHPIRVVLDTKGRIPAASNVLDSSVTTLLVHADDTVPDYRSDAQGFAVRRINGHLDLAAVMTQLGQREINEVQVEAGSLLASGLLQAELIDELLLYVAPVLLGDLGRPLFADCNPLNMSERIGFRIRQAQMMGDDLRLILTRN